MRNNSILSLKVFGIFFVTSFFSGCASILIPKDPIEVSNVSKPFSCIKLKGSALVNLIGRADTETNYDDSEEGRLLKNKIESVFFNNSSGPCKKYNYGYVNIINAPKDYSGVLRFVNILTIGIVPYWDKMENTFELKVMDENMNEIGLYRSTIEYTRYNSIFLWPAMPFYLKGEWDLNLATFDQHVASIERKLVEKPPVAK